MKKVFAIICLFAVIFCNQAFAENYWPRTFFVQAGFNTGVSIGDLNERSLTLNDTTGAEMKVYPPDLGFIGAPEIVVGSNMRFFTLALSFQYTSFSEKLTDYVDTDPMTTSFWRFGFEFTYNFNWPENFQVGVGLGYSFSNISVNNSAYLDDESYHTEFKGLGIAAILNAHYYFTQHFAVVPAIKIYENWFKNIYTSPSELCDMDPYLWQTFFTASISVQYQF